MLMLVYVVPRLHHSARKWHLEVRGGCISPCCASLVWYVLLELSLSGHGYMYVCVVGAVAVVTVVASWSATSVPGQLAEDVLRPPSFMVVSEC